MSFSSAIRTATIAFASVVFPAAQGFSAAPVIEGLVVRLGDASREARDEAEEKIGALGPTVLPELARLLPDATGETALRIRRLMVRLETALVEASSEPARVTLAVDDTPVCDLLERIAAATGNRIPIDETVAAGSAGGKRVSAAFDRATYWEAIQAALEKGGLDLECLDHGGGLRITAADRPRPPAAAAEQLLVMVPRIDRGRGAGPRTLKLTVRLVWEPRLSPLVVRLPMESVQVEGPAGEAIPPANRIAMLEAASAGTSRWVDIVVPLAAVEPLPESLGMVRGTVRLWLAAGEHDFDFDLSQARLPQRIRVGDAEVTLSRLERAGRRLRVTAGIAYDRASEPLASHRTWLVDRELAFVADRDDASAPPVTPVGQKVEHRSDTGLEASAEFDLPEAVGDRAVIRWRLPAALREVPVEFVLRDIPLP